MLYIDQFVYGNKLRHIHPLGKAIFVFIAMLIGLSVGKSVLHVLIMLVMYGLLYFQAKIPGRVLVKTFLVPLVFLLLGAGTIALTISTDSREMLVYFRIAPYHFGFSAGGLNLAIETSFKALSLISCLYLLAFTTPLPELIYVLKCLRIPRTLTDMMIVIYRFIFIFMVSVVRIYTAQSARSGYSSLSQSRTSLGILLANIWGKAFIRAKRVHHGLVARGYEEDLKVLNPPFHFSLGRIFFFAFIELMFIIAAIL